MFQIADALTVVASFWLAFYIRFTVQPSYLPLPQGGVEFRDYGILLVSLVFVWFLALQISGAYKSFRQSFFSKELLSILRASGLAFMIVVSLAYFFAREDFSRLVLVLYIVIVIAGLICERLILRLILRALRRRGWNLRYVVFVGDPQLAQAVTRRLQARPELGVRVKGVIPVGGASSQLTAEGLKIPTLGSIDEIEEVISREGIDQVLICLKNESAHELDRILSTLMSLNVYTRIIPDISQYAILGFEVEEFDGIPIVTLNHSPLVGWNAVLKRVSDVVFAIVALIVFSPLMLLLVLIVRLTSRGPIFYSQERMGLDGRTFKMLKFRSMKVDAESSTGAVWARKDDQRVTWIGGLMRKTSLDELPQLFNVLAGDMSCVGPRPERPVFVSQFRHKIPGYMLRHKVKAGMTGWAQINGLRGNTSLEARIEHDLYYITHWSIALDIKIMFLTIFKGFVSPHAY